MFIKLSEKKEINTAVTDVFALDKKLIKYKSLLRILENIHALIYNVLKSKQLSNNP